MRGGTLILFLASVIFGIYLINSTIGFYPLPEYVKNLDGVLRVIAGALLLIGAFYTLIARSRRDFGFHGLGR
ncbi:MAG TPA: hypothetical protein VJZ93_00345 [Candidatus Nanoarchaeia archaeon]|nr:hypothetical protein [Candidatus Nanoarchaeia archaeon]